MDDVLDHAIERMVAIGDDGVNSAVSRLNLLMLEIIFS
jgi:hypothetical protein